MRARIQFQSKLLDESIVKPAVLEMSKNTPEVLLRYEAQEDRRCVCYIFILKCAVIKHYVHQP